MTMRLLSLNVNGLCNINKRNSIYNWLKEPNADVIFLQETHCNNENDKIQWQKEWDGLTYWCIGTKTFLILLL